MKKAIMAAILTCLIAQPAWAGWVVIYKNAQGAKSQEYYDRGKINAEGLIYAGGSVITVDEDSRAYWKGTLQQFCHAFKAQMQQIQSMIPAQYRPKPISQRKVTRKGIGSKSIAGFSAKGYEFYVDDSQEEQIWVSSDSGLSGLIDMKNSMSKKMRCLDDMNKAELEDSTLYKKTTKGKFVLKDSSREVVSVEEKQVPASHFEAPAGYKSFSNYQQFMDYISNHSKSSSRAPSRVSAPSFDMPSRQRSSPARREPRSSSYDGGSQSGRSADDDQIPNVDDIKEGATEILKSLGDLFGN